MASRPYQASRYLQDPQDQAAYLNEVLNRGDNQALLTALQNLAKVEPPTDWQWVAPATTQFAKLNQFLQSFGLRLSIEVVNPTETVQQT